MNESTQFQSKLDVNQSHQKSVFISEKLLLETGNYL